MSEKMPYYIININQDKKGLNEVHTTECTRKSKPENSVSLGYHSNAKAAVNYAKLNGWKEADGCYYCCNEAHKG